MALKGIMHGSETLEAFIDRVVRTPEQFRTRIKNAINELVQHLHQLKIPDHSIQEVVKSGSLGKGTSVMANADADMVVFFNGYATMEDLIADKPNIIKQVKKHMLGIKQPPDWIDRIQVLRSNDYFVSFRIHLMYEGKKYHVEFDVLPAIDVLKKCGGSLSTLYAEMHRLPERVRSHYSACLCKLQIELIGSNQPAKAKDLIRLLKYWAKTNNLDDMKSYCCEVIGWYVYEEHLRRKTDFKMKVGFSKVLELISSYNTIKIVKSSKYNTSDSFVRVPAAPCVLDPVNPFSNTAYSEPRAQNIARQTLTSLSDVPN